MKVLVIDDSSVDRKLLKAVFEHAGYEVAEAGSGSEALTILQTLRVAVIVVDVFMPNLDGFRFCHELRKDSELRDVPVIIYTGDLITAQDKILAAEIGANRFLQKSGSTEELLSAVRTLCSTDSYSNKPSWVGDEQFLTRYSERMACKVEERNVELAEVFRCSEDAVMTSTPEGVILTWNPGAERLFGYAAEEIINTQIACLVPSDGLDEWQDLLRRVVSGERCGSIETLRVTRDGVLVDVSISLSPIRDHDGRVVRISHITRNITERKKTERELLSSREQLRGLAARLRTIREEEAARIARELHDDLGQALTALNMDLAWLLTRARKIDEAALREPLCERIDRMSLSLQSTNRSMKRICTELRPSLLDHLGLVAALEWQTEEFATRTGVRCVWANKPGQLVLCAEIATTIFRVFQEILTNITRHAAATNVCVSLDQISTSVELIVTDDGKGFAAEQLPKAGSLGILGMRERALAAGGLLDVQSTPGKGTRVLLLVPV